MQDTELFLSLAEIAGVFVGFGALIAVRSGGAGEAEDVAPVRGVVMTGMGTIIGALVPVTLGRYDLTGHQVLVLSSFVVLVSYSGLALLHIRSPEYKAIVATAGRSGTLGVVEDAVETAAFVLILGGSAVALIIILSGVAPDLEAALYFTVVVLILLQAAWTLLWLVMRQRRPASA